MKYDFGSSSIYLTFSGDFSEDDWFAVKMNFATDDFGYLQIRFDKTATGITAKFYGEETLLQETSHTCEQPVIDLVSWSNFFAVYVNENWIGNFYMEGVYYPQEPEVQFKGNTSVTIKKHQMTDWKEAFYLEMDTGIGNGLASILGQRIVIMRNRSDGVMEMFYPQENRTPVSLGKVVSHDVTADVPQAFSDNIVYATNVDTFTSMDVLKRFGFRTGIHRLPDLDAGALRAAGLANKIRTQSIEKHDAQVMGYNPAIEIDDEVEFGGERFIVEGINFTVKLDLNRLENSSRLSGRSVE